ncbi:hypothetical protein BKA61DRAFT_654853, partial [Leptodontidium sp. MPI-SDFR-AT-0119]
MLQKEVFGPGGTGSRKPIPYEISLIKPTLGHFHQCTHIFESQLAPVLQANFFWGIVGVLLQLTARDSQALSKIPRMLKSLSYKAEAFKRHYSASSQENLDETNETKWIIATDLRPLSSLQRHHNNTIYPGFFNRLNTFEKIDQAHGRDGSTPSFRSTALFGLGGIGKSSIAARYIEREIEEKKYNAMFWVYGETKSSLRQSSTDIALRLKLPGLELVANGRFSEAIEPLLTLALIKRDKDARVFSAALVYHAFPKQSDATNKNQLYQPWTQCNGCLQYLLYLKDNFKEERRHSKKFKASSLFCELLKDCQRYLYEINALRELEDVCGVNFLAVETLGDKEPAIDIKASTLSHQASMYENIGKVEQAIELNTKGYNMRLEEKPLKGGLGGFEQNLAYNYNSANQHETALTWFEKSRDTWIAWNVKEGRKEDWPTVTKKNTARCLVYLGKHGEALTLLDTSIKEFKQEIPLNWAMLAYTYFVLDVLERRRDRPKAAEANFME